MPAIIIPPKPTKKNKTVEKPIAVNQIEAARLLSISSVTLRELTKTGQVPFRKLGSKVLYSVAVLERFASGENFGGDDNQ